MISIIDYKVGNIFNVRNALKYLGFESEVINTKKKVENAKSIILPGVGAFDDAIKQLKEDDILSCLKNKILEGTPTLGICLGMQLLAKQSEEGIEEGLGIFNTNVKMFKSKKGIIPHMGWNKVEFLDSSSKYFYFVHSFYLPITKYTTGTTNYITEFSSIIEKNNIIATQFHTEKSGIEGLKILKKFGDLSC
ncbi:MAG: imidazole glycerol phosphate synthase subunit HisH [Clostridia bacterium]